MRNNDYPHLGLALPRPRRVAGRRLRRRRRRRERRTNHFLSVREREGEKGRAVLQPALIRANWKSWEPQ